MQKVLLGVAALQFVLAAATVQPVATSTQSPLLLDELSRFSEINTNNAVQSLAPIDISLVPNTEVPLDTALGGLPADLTAGVYAESGIASFYSGGHTANGETAVAGEMTAAHRTLPFGTMVRVTNRKNGNSLVVRVNDRGPFVAGRVIDLTAAGALALGFSLEGLASVSLALEPVSLAPEDGGM
jgi:rare lipoprotein A